MAATAIQQQPESPVEDQPQRQQHEQRYEAGEVLAEERQPQPPQRIGPGQHDLHQAARMDAAVKAQGKRSTCSK